MGPLVSVIVPAYKTEPFLEKCIASIIAQTYESLEIILVDDGSPDRCGQICDQMAERDHRIRVIHQDNQGLSAARNRGIDECRGEYILFVDSDDWIEPETVECLLKASIDAGADVSCCGVVWETGKDSVASPLTSVKKTYEGETIITAALKEEFAPFAWNKLWKADLFGKKEFGGKELQDGQLPDKQFQDGQFDGGECSGGELQDGQFCGKQFQDGQFGGGQFGDRQIHDEQSCGRQFSRRQCDGSVRFPVGRYFEDLSTNWRLFDRCERVVCVPEVLFHYTVRSDSISNSKTMKNLADRWIAYKERFDEMAARSAECHDICVNGCLETIAYTWRWIHGVRRADRAEYEGALREMKGFLKAYRDYVGRCSATTRVALICALHSGTVTEAGCYYLNQAYRRMRGKDQMVR